MKNLWNFIKMWFSKKADEITINKDELIKKANEAITKAANEADIDKDNKISLKEAWLFAKKMFKLGWNIIKQTILNLLKENK